MIDFTSLFEYAFFQRAFIGGVCAAILCSVMGVFIVLRRASLIGEGIAHLSFGGIALGLFMSIYPLYTALFLSLLGTIAISYLSRKKVVYTETAIGLLISFGLALGAILASLSGGFSVDLFGYLFGSILTISQTDLDLILVLTIVAGAFLILFYKELMALTFDEQGARLAGIPVRWLDFLFNLLMAITVVVSIKIVGSLLVTALLIAPAASAIQFSRSFRGTSYAALVLGVLAVTFGLLFSFTYALPSGGTIVMVSLCIFVGSIAAKKVLVWAKGPQEAPETICTHAINPLEVGKE